MVIKIKAKGEIGLYKDYIHFLHPILKVTPQETDVLAHMMMMYNNIKKDVKKVEYVNKLLFTTDNRNKISEDLDMSKIRYDAILTKFRGMGIMKDRTLISKIIPKIVNGIVEVNVKISESGK